jgi:hypothetical protein
VSPLPLIADTAAPKIARDHLATDQHDFESPVVLERDGAELVLNLL